MSKRPQASKRSRKHRKQAKFAKLRSNTGHSSHLSAKRWNRFQGRFIKEGTQGEED